MKPGDTVYANVPQKKALPKRCRGIIQEIHGAVAKVNFWDGKKHVDMKMMVKDLEQTTTHL